MPAASAQAALAGPGASPREAGGRVQKFRQGQAKLVPLMDAAAAARALIGAGFTGIEIDEVVMAIAPPVFLAGPRPHGLFCRSLSPGNETPPP